MRPGEPGVFYWGGGDDPTFYRFYIEKQWYDGLQPVGKDERFVFTDTKPLQQPDVGTWAHAPEWDSKGNMYFSWSIWPRVILFRKVK